MAGATRLSQLGAAAGFNLSDVQEFVVSSFTSPDWMQITLLSASIIYIAEFVLDIRQSAHLQNDPFPDQLQGIISSVAYVKLQNYSLMRINYNRFESTAAFVLEFLILLSGFLVTIWDFTGTFDFSFAAPLDAGHLRSISFLFCVSLLSMVGRLPFELGRVLIIDKPHSMSRLTAFRRWVADQTIMFFVTVLTGVPLIYVALWLMDFRADYYWVYNWAFISLAGVTMTDIYPMFLAPWFHSYKELPNSPLRDELQALADRVHVAVSEIYVLDSGKRTSACNAFLMGFGKRRSIVLYDNLVRSLSDDEILAVIVHEIGHVKYNHSWKKLFLQLAYVGLFLWLFTQVIDSIEFFAAFGFVETDVAVGLALFSYMYAPLGNTLNCISNVITRGFEYTADEYALALGFDMEEALVKMHTTSLTNLLPDKMYARYHFSHPSLFERLQKLAAFKTRVARAGESGLTKNKRD